ncbi:MAG TPA: disulfide bond formation protein B [Candidatus Zambryskibacteria bacterium]|nr:MAG: putative disulfide formation protein [Parcubacteria group bacterium GW2011_GWC1_39_12]KKR19050.1 MAG: putative disulfide formation protein [Parcubacteria group bacterium GW2011_GWF1_39_37]KKR35617.1 MAG: putative disulfide formation protein [Parcubacteria group bacterium GW2011_GWC2_40_10]KKR52028.1 MAG: putative disulfide formation protein [Parcubacteria group bacterium GW2011_GWE1_40_20]KKR65995.1 MAG: putative disulfide formation protein [Parcubacteria group bacterium GW2011_GWB1_40_
MIQFIQTNATPIVGFLTMLSNVIFVGVILVIVLHSGTRAKMYAFVHKYILELLFWGIMAAVVGSLVYSEIVGFPACDLCWYQRLFLYPQAIIVLLAMRRKDKTIIDYLVPLSILGGLVALYQSIIQWGFSFGSILDCTAVGGECAKVYVNEYSYITIPFMSLSVFVYIITMKYVYYSHRKNIEK